MLVLALDTTIRGGSCALADGVAVVREEGSDASRPQAERVPSDLMGLLDRTGVTLPQIDAFAVATGPGSFTGLRIGIATMQGLAFATGKPLVGVSGFDALAHLEAAHGAARIATWVDAWRGEVYAALYEQGREIEAPVVAHPESLLAGALAGPTVFVGDGAETYRMLIQERCGEMGRIAAPARPLLAGAIAVLAGFQIGRGAHPAPGDVRPLYVRRPDAEMAREVRGPR